MYNINSIYKKMILLVGKSGSGKDFFINAFNLDYVISRTTRQKREYEINSVHKKFRTIEDFKKEEPKSIAKTYINNSYYWVLESDLKGKDVYIIDRAGVNSLQKSYSVDFDKRFKVVYIKTNFIKRFKNMYKRNDKIKNIFSRLLNDRKEFKGIEKLADVIIKI